jgi:hypothetical protein
VIEAKTLRVTVHNRRLVDAEGQRFGGYETSLVARSFEAASAPSPPIQLEVTSKHFASLGLDPSSFKVKPCRP